MHCAVLPVLLSGALVSLQRRCSARLPHTSLRPVGPEQPTEGPEGESGWLSSELEPVEGGGGGGETRQSQQQHVDRKKETGSGRTRRLKWLSPSSPWCDYSDDGFNTSVLPSLIETVHTPNFKDFIIWIQSDLVMTVYVLELLRLLLRSQLVNSWSVQRK